MVRPRLDLLANRTFKLIAPLYSLPSAPLTEVDLRDVPPWEDIADLIKLLRGPARGLENPETIPSEFSDLTGEHVRLAVQRGKDVISAR
jgi:hypothetical protein